MNDIEKVIEGLEYCSSGRGGSCISCPGGMECWCDEAIKLLKEKEPIVPKLGGKAGPFGTEWYQCGACSGQIDPYDKYCRHCGQVVEWDE